MSVTPPRSTDVSSAKILVLLAALAALPYLNGIGGDFTYDDVAVIRDNPVGVNNLFPNTTSKFSKALTCFWSETEQTQGA